MGEQFKDYKYFVAVIGENGFLYLKDLLPMVTLSMAKNTRRAFKDCEEDIAKSEYIGWYATIPTRNMHVLSLVTRLGAVPYAVGPGCIHVAKVIKEV